MTDLLVIDASALVEFLLGTAIGQRVSERLKGHALHAPAHLDAEVLSALGGLQRDGRMTEEQVGSRLAMLVAAPIDRHALPALLIGAWRRRHTLRLVDAFYVELTNQLEAMLLTTNRRLAAAGEEQVVTV